jgi:hypothetical protein
MHNPARIAGRGMPERARGDRFGGVSAVGQRNDHEYDRNCDEEGVFHRQALVHPVWRRPAGSIRLASVTRGVEVG